MVKNEAERIVETTLEGEGLNESLSIHEESLSPGINKKQKRTKTKEEKIAYAKEYYRKNKEKIAQRRKVYREKNKEAIAAYAKSYREKHKDDIAKRAKVYREKNKDSIASYARSWYQKNKSLVAVKTKLYRENNKEKNCFKEKRIS